MEVKKLTKVADLKKQIKDIQKNCRHRFEILKKPQLDKSKAKGVYLAPPSFFVLKCSDCEKERQLDVTRVCPRCFGRMTSGLFEPHEKYFFGEKVYYVAQESRCSKSKCGFAVVSEVYDR